MSQSSTLVTEAVPLRIMNASGALRVGVFWGGFFWFCFLLLMGEFEAEEAKKYGSKLCIWIFIRLFVYRLIGF